MMKKKSGGGLKRKDAREKKGLPAKGSCSIPPYARSRLAVRGEKDIQEGKKRGARNFSRKKGEDDPHRAKTVKNVRGNYGKAREFQSAQKRKGVPQKKKPMIEERRR